MTYISSEQEFNAFIIDKVFVEFMSKDCKACVLAEPFLVEIKNAYPFSVATVDITNIPILVSKYSLTVVPTFILFEEQKELFRFEGFANKHNLERLIRRYK